MKIAENISPEELDLIDAFLLSAETDLQKKAFALKMQLDSEWENKIETIRLLKAGISEAAIKIKLNSFHEEIANNFRKETIIKKFYKPQKVWWAAASIISLLIISFFLFKNNKYENAYAKYYKPDPGLITVMGIASNYAFEEGMVQYKNEEYAKALKLWEAPLKNAPQNDTLLYFTAAAHQALHQNEKATANYLKVLAQPNSVFYKDASWYQALIYIENKETEKAKILLTQSEREASENLIKKIR